MITVKNLTVRLDNFVLERFNLIVPQSGYAVLMGKTGCGKTTLIECICGLKRVQSGSIFFGDHDVTGLRPAERGVGYVLFGTKLPPRMTGVPRAILSPGGTAQVPHRCARFRVLIFPKPPMPCH